MALEDIEADLANAGIDPDIDNPRTPEEGGPPLPPETPEPAEGGDDVPEEKNLLDDLFNSGEGTTPGEGAPANEGEGEGDDEPLPQGVTPHAGEAFKRLRGENKELKARLKELEAAGAGAQGAPAEEVETLRKELLALKEDRERIQRENEEYLSELRVTRIEATPEYKSAVVEPLNRISQVAESLSKKYGVDTTTLMKAITETDPDKQSDLLVDAGASFNDLDRTRLYRLGEAHNDILFQKETLTKNAKMTLEEIEAARKSKEEAAKADYQKNLASISANSWNEVKKQVPILKKVEGNDQWNEAVDKIEALATTSNPDELSPEGRVRAMQMAIVLPTVMQLLRQSHAEVSSLRKRVSALTKATPSAGGGGQAAPTGGATDTSEGGFLESLDKINLSIR